MREIKFRVKIKDSYGGGWDYTTMDSENYLTWSKSTDSHDKKTRGQYTGLKDKNGKEIYESDRVKDKDGNDGVVHFLAPKFIVVYPSESGVLAGNDLSEVFEVIGNIYENDRNTG